MAIRWVKLTFGSDIQKLCFDRKRFHFYKEIFNSMISTDEIIDETISVIKKITNQ